MGVPKSDRSLSKLEALNHAKVLRKSITELLLRDFGVKKRKWRTDRFNIVYDFTEEDAQVMAEMYEKYGVSDITEEFPEWLVHHVRVAIMDTLDDMINNLIAANTIYATNVEEFTTRRKYMTDAIANCEQLLQHMQYCIDIFPVDANKYMRFVDDIEEEIRIIKGWRRSDNKKIKQLIPPDRDRLLTYFKSFKEYACGDMDLEMFLMSVFPEWVQEDGEIKKKGSRAQKHQKKSSKSNNAENKGMDQENNTRKMT